jgi:phosphate transport system substrate-binding protein
VEWPVDLAGNGVGAQGNQGVAEAVTNTANSLGYVELSYAVSNNLIYADMINRAGKRVRPNAASLASALDALDAGALDEQLTASITDGASEGAWPIAGFTYLLLHSSSMTDCVKARKLLDYMYWTLTDPSAARRAAQLGYAVLPEALRGHVIDTLGDVTCHGQRVMK